MAGYKHAQYYMGNVFYYGNLRDQNYSKALTWYHMAALQDLAKAQYQLGQMYENGQGTMKGLEQAIDFYQQAAAQNHKKAQHSLQRLKASASQ